MNNTEYLKLHMNNTMVYVNGEIKKAEDATISIFDRSFLYGDSVYEVTRTYGGRIFALEAHLDRLWQSMSLLSITPSVTKAQVTEAVERTYAAVNLPNCYIRIMITRGVGEIGLDIAKVNSNNLVVIVKEFKTNPDIWYKEGIDYIIAQTRRMPKDSLNPLAKTGNYLNSILALIEAKKAGAFDAILLDHEGYVTEGSTNNIWVVKNKSIYTPSMKRGILKGITRDILFKIAEVDKIDLKEKDFFLEELMQADEVFMTSSLKEIVPIVKIDNILIASGKPGAVTQDLHQRYKNKINQFIQKGTL